MVDLHRSDAAAAGVADADDVGQAVVIEVGRRDRSHRHAGRQHGRSAEAVKAAFFQVFKNRLARRGQHAILPLVSRLLTHTPGSKLKHIRLLLVRASSMTSASRTPTRRGTVARTESQNRS